MSAPRSTATATDLPPFPNPSASWSQDHPVHSGWLQHGVEDTPGRKAYFIQLEARPGKEELLAAFLDDIHAGVDKEPGTGPWFGLRYSKTSFAIFEAFPSAAARHDHDKGPGGTNFLRAELLKDMLAYPAQVFRLDVLHGKFGTMFGQSVSPVIE